MEQSAWRCSGDVEVSSAECGYLCKHSSRVPCCRRTSPPSYSAEESYVDTAPSVEGSLDAEVSRFFLWLSFECACPHSPSARAVWAALRPPPEQCMLRKMLRWWPWLEECIRIQGRHTSRIMLCSFIEVK